jgi:hypothetical protein
MIIYRQGKKGEQARWWDVALRVSVLQRQQRLSCSTVTPFRRAMIELSNTFWQFSQTKLWRLSDQETAFFLLQQWHG